MSSSPLYQMSEKDQVAVKALGGNERCADCQARNPTWASVSFGTLLCIKHSGAHRGMGTHISFVRSLDMDSWTEAQVQKMKCGGNDACNEFLRKHGVDTSTSDVKEKYSSSAALLYKEVLKARVQGKPEPTELPKVVAAEPRKKKVMEGIGSSPPPRPARTMARTKKLIVVGASVAVAVVGWVVLR